MEALADAARRALVQDLHVLRRLRPARPGRPGRAAPLPDDRPRGHATTSRTSSSSCARPDASSARTRRWPTHVSVSLHCEIADILNAYTRLVAAGRLAHGPARLQRRPAAALRGARGLDRRLPRQRGGLRQREPAAPVLAQGAGGGADDGRASSRTSTSGARSPSATCCSTSTRPPAPTPRSTRRSARARTSSSCGARCSTARSTGSSATTPAAPRR